MAPEQLYAGKFFNHSTDAWSLGIILHELLIDERPFYDDSLQELARKIRDEEIDYSSEAWEEISIEAVDLVENLL